MLKGIHIGSYWMGSNDVVYLMCRELSKLCDLVVVDPQLYSQEKTKWVEPQYSRKHQINWLKDDIILPLVMKEKPDFVVCNSGGISFTPSGANKVKALGITLVGISLSDPDVFEKQGKNYCKLYDLYYSNSLLSVRSQYPRIGVEAKLLPFAASPAFHRPLNTPKTFDIVVVGHARKERVKVVSELEKSFSVGLYGNGWKTGRQVNGEEQVEAINSGKIYLSFPFTYAKYVNVKVGVFEAIACKSFVITSFLSELENYFKFGTEIVGYENPEHIAESIRFYLDNPKIRDWISNNAYQRLLRDHTWEQRWRTVLADIEKKRKKAV